MKFGGRPESIPAFRANIRNDTPFWQNSRSPRTATTREIMMKLSVKCAAGILGFALATSAFAQDNKLRLITWADYVPADVVAQFKKETGIDVEVTLSNNEEMISKLRATGGAGLRSRAAVAGPHRRSAAGIRHLQADRHDARSRRTSSSRRCSTRRRRTRRSRARSTGCRTSGAPMVSSSTPSSRRWPTTRTSARPSTRARPACA